MNIESLRPEYVITGASVILAALWLSYGFGDHEGQSFLRYIIERSEDANAPILVAVAIALSYVVGAFVVQITYWYPTKHMVAVIQRARFMDLRVFTSLAGIDSRDERDPRSQLAFGANISAANARSFTHRWSAHRQLHRNLPSLLDLAFPRPGPKALVQAENDYNYALTSELHGSGGSRTDEERTSAAYIVRRAESLVLTYGRSLLGAERSTEFHYRRANRQVFTGLWPAWCMISVGVGPAFELPPWLGGTVAIIVAVAGVALLWSAAMYQERIAQSQIIDSAFEKLMTVSSEPPQQ